MTRIFLTVVFLLSYSLKSRADFKFDMLFGYYDFSAETNTTSGKLSALGLYTFSVRKSFAPQFDFGLGYTLQMSKSFLGDVSYGPDLNAYYFPISNATPVIAKNQISSFVLNEIYRPFLGLGFHQRNYQSSKSSYAGFSLQFGCEFDINQMFSLTTQLRHLNLSGPQDSKAKDLNLLAGLTFWF